MSRQLACFLLAAVCLTPATAFGQDAAAARIRAAIAQRPPAAGLLDSIVSDAGSLLMVTPRDAATEAIARKGLGYVAMLRMESALAETHLLRALELDAGDAEMSFWLGQITSIQKKANWRNIALFHYARAASYTGPGALAPEPRRNIMHHARKAFEKSFGTDEKAFADLLAASTKTALPPPDFTIAKP